MEWERIEKLRFRIAVGFASFLMIWPLVHMMWALNSGLNATKLAGWGMYSVVRAREIGVTVMFVEQGGSPLDRLDLGAVVGTARMVRIEKGEVVELGSLGEVSPSVGKTVEYVQVFRATSDVHRLVERLRSAMRRKVAMSPPMGPVLVLVSEPRLSLLREHSFTHTTAYLSRGNQTHCLGDYRSDVANAAEILADIEMKLVSRIGKQRAIDFDTLTGR